MCDYCGWGYPYWGYGYPTNTSTVYVPTYAGLTYYPQVYYSAAPAYYYSAVKVERPRGEFRFGNCLLICQ